MKKIDFEKIKYGIQDNLLFIGIWSLALLTVLSLNFQNKNSLSFVGVTDSKEVNINLKHAVLVKQIHVLPGQLVKKGQLLAELERPDLVKQMNEVSHRLEELHNQLTLNEKLNNSLKSIKRKKRDIDNSLTIQIRSLENQYEFLRKEQEELFIFANFDGHVGFVNYKSGESVSPFAPIITMHQKTPTFVRGYVHESIMNQIKIGSQIKISSINSDKVMEAQVTSVGTRIIEFPERFRRSIQEKIWGREVGIKLKPENNFLLGEKVFLEVIGVGSSEDTKKRTLANGEIIIKEGETSYHEITIPTLIRDLNRVEPSGLVYLQDLNQFLVVSDDTFENKPFVYLLNNSGDIDQRILMINGIEKIKDMEAMSKDEEGNLYVVSSLSEDKKGKMGKERRRIIRFTRQGLELQEDKKTDLLTALNDLAVLDPSQDWAKLLLKKNLIESKFKIEMDVEGLAVKEDAIYLGLRKTFGENGEVIVLKISNANEMFETDTLSQGQVSLFKKIILPKSDKEEGISDLMIHNDQLYFLTADNKDNDKGKLFKVSMLERENTAHLITEFEDHRPEGLSLNTSTNELTIVFDNNKSKKAYMTKVQI